MLVTKRDAVLYAMVFQYNYNNQISNQLLCWGLERADLLGLEVWVYANPVLESFYASHRFQVVERRRIEAKYTLEGDYHENSSKQDMLLVMRRSAEDNRLRHRAHYLNTQGFF